MSNWASIYTLPVGKKWLLVSPLSLTTALVNNAAVTALSACTDGDVVNTPKPLIDLWSRLCETSTLPRLETTEPEKLVVIPTRMCNMRCVYCDFAPQTVRTQYLDPRLACKLIDSIVSRPDTISGNKLRIHFFGGEPLVARQCVETIVHYARMVCARKGLTPWFEITTNGLFGSSAVSFLGDYIDSVVVSLDGTEVLHDFNRRRLGGKGTYDSIAANIRKLGKYPVELSLRACITDRSVNAMTDITSHFCSEFEFDNLCFEMLAANKSSYDAGLRPPDPIRFAAGVLKAETLADACGVRVIHGPAELTRPRITSCPVGRGTLMLNPDGRLTACYQETKRWTDRGIDPVLGYVDPESGPMTEPRKYDAIKRLVETKPRCDRCFCRHTCAGGCHLDQTPPGCSLEFDDRCQAIRIITAGRLLRNLEGPTAVEAFARQSSMMRGVAENADDRLSFRFKSTSQRQT